MDANKTLDFIPKQITEFSDFLQILSPAVESFKDSYTRWTHEHSKEELAAALLNKFRAENQFFGELSETNELKYFCALLREEETKIFFWIIYVHPTMREYTKALCEWLKDYYRARGVKTCEFTTSRITSSYKRWAAKMGAYQHTITYRIDL